MRRATSHSFPSGITFIFCLYILSSTSFTAFSFSLSTAATKSNSTGPTIASTKHDSKDMDQQLSGDWSNAKKSLRNPKCCVVSVSSLENHISTLQQYFFGDDAPADLDLRMRVRCNNSNVADDVTYTDCSNIYNAMMGRPAQLLRKGGDYSPRQYDGSNQNNKISDVDNISIHNHPCILALEELAKGVASLADGPLEGKTTDVYMRVVCASNYQAIDPMFHTDKCPLRGYVTLTGPGTEFLDETCLPWEYAALRTLGVNGLSAMNSGKARSLKTAKELEFIVMKGDHYNAPLPDGISPSMTSKLWSRSSACVHRSPPSAAAVTEKSSIGIVKSSKRIILSLDLADGLDDQEWYEISRKRGWRSGMTQRKSHLVS